MSEGTRLGALRAGQGGVIGITGSNGKTTTTALTGHILGAAKVPSQVGGNIGRPPASMVATSSANQWNVLELSSFQLDGVSNFEPSAAVVLNVTVEVSASSVTLVSTVPVVATFSKFPPVFPVIVTGVGVQTEIGGDGSDTFVFAKESGDIAGPTGDVIQDFNLGKNGGLQSDTLSLYHLFDTALVNQLGKGSVNDANKLANYLKLEWTRDANNLQMVCSIDTTGQGQFSKLVTLTDLLDSVGTVNFDAAKPDQTRLYGGESTNALLQKMLEEGRLVIQ